MSEWIRVWAEDGRINMQWGEGKTEIGKINWSSTEDVEAYSRILQKVVEIVKQEGARTVPPLFGQN